MRSHHCLNIQTFDVLTRHPSFQLQTLTPRLITVSHGHAYNSRIGRLAMDRMPPASRANRLAASEMLGDHFSRSIQGGLPGIALDGDSSRHRQGDILASVKAHHAPQEPSPNIVRPLAANCAGLATFDRSAELHKVWPVEGATTIAAGAWHQGAVFSPVINLASAVAAGAVKERR